jgi:iron complex outermembrane receptor protein
MPGFRVQPFVSVQNIANRRYVGSVVVNAAGGRYFEPAAARSLRFGLTLGTR